MTDQQIADHLHNVPDMNSFFTQIYTLTYFSSLVPLKLFDLLHGTKYSGIEKTGDIDGRYEYYPSSVFSFPLLKRYIRKQMNNGRGHSVLDIGCGKGFVLHFFSCLDFDRVAGIEYERELSRLARQNIAVKAGREAKVYCGDAAKFGRYGDYDTFYMYNPFDEATLECCVDRILGTLDINPRKLTIFYCNPVYKDVLMRRGFKEVKHFYYKTSIFVKTPKTQ